jgi:hypothetical protein
MLWSRINTVKGLFMEISSCAWRGDRTSNNHSNEEVDVRKPMLQEWRDLCARVLAIADQKRDSRRKKPMAISAFSCSHFADPAETCGSFTFCFSERNVVAVVHRELSDWTEAFAAFFYASLCHKQWLVSWARLHCWRSIPVPNNHQNSTIGVLKKVFQRPQLLWNSI